MVKPQKLGNKTRMSFSKINEVLDMPNLLDVQKKYGKNALLKGMNLEEGAMTRERNGQIGGHKA